MGGTCQRLRLPQGLCQPGERVLCLAARRGPTEEEPRLCPRTCQMKPSRSSWTWPPRWRASAGKPCSPPWPMRWPPHPFKEPAGRTRSRGRCNASITTRRPTHASGPTSVGPDLRRRTPRARPGPLSRDAGHEAPGDAKPRPTRALEDLQRLKRPTSPKRSCFPGLCAIPDTNRTLTKVRI